LIDGMARQITTALTMSLEERCDRWQSMVRKLKAGSSSFAAPANDDSTNTKR
jgi:trehalose-6-phosphate synthase